LVAALATVIVLLVLDVLNAHPRIALTRVAIHLNDELPDSVRVHASGLLEYHGRAHAFGLHAATCKLTSGDGHHIVQSALDGPISSTDGTLNVTMMVWVASSNLVGVAVADWQAGFTIECGLRLWVSVLGLSFAFPVTVTVKDVNRKGYDASMSERDYQEDHLLAIRLDLNRNIEPRDAIAAGGAAVLKCSSTLGSGSGGSSSLLGGHWRLARKRRRASLHVVLCTNGRGKSRSTIVLFCIYTVLRRDSCYCCSTQRFVVELNKSKQVKSSHVKAS
jgi:hypothetical protein